MTEPDRHKYPIADLLQEKERGEPPLTAKAEVSSLTAEKDDAAPRHTCAECGESFAEDEMLQYEELRICALCKPLFVQKIKEGLTIAGRLRYAGFPVRMVAKGIDGIITMIFGMGIGIPAFIWLATRPRTNFAPESLGFLVFQNVFMVVFYALLAFYNTWFIVKYRATPGKMACNIEVVTAEGDKVGYGRALGRFFAELLSYTLMFGYIIAAFDDERRTLHDRVCETRVVHK